MVSTNRESRQRTVAIHTHGCKLNQADSQALARRFREAGIELAVAPRAIHVSAPVVAPGE